MAGPVPGVGLDANRWGEVPLLFPRITEGMGQGTPKPAPKAGYQANHGSSSPEN